MGFLDEVMKSRTNDEIKTRMYDLIRIMQADRKIEPNEEILLVKVANRISLSENELKQIIKQVMTNPRSIKVSYPTDPKEKINYLLDMVAMMMVDANIDIREAIICETIAIKPGFRPQIVPEMIKTLIDLAVKNVPRQTIKTELDEFMSKKE